MNIELSNDKVLCVPEVIESASFLLPPTEQNKKAFTHRVLKVAENITSVKADDLIIIGNEWLGYEIELERETYRIVDIKDVLGVIKDG